MSKMQRTIPGYPDYSISEDGVVTRIVDGATRKAGHILSPKTERGGYLRVKLSVNGVKKLEPIHRLVCSAFNGIPSLGQVCRHLDGNPSNNHFSNLAWGSCLDNHNDRRRHGRSFGGDKNGRAILTAELVNEMRSEFRGTYGEYTRLSRKYGISDSQVHEIIKGQSWA